VGGGERRRASTYRQSGILDPHFDGSGFYAPKIGLLLGRGDSQPSRKPPHAATGAAGITAGLLQQGLARWLPTMLARIRTIASTASGGINGRSNGPAAGLPRLRANAGGQGQLAPPATRPQTGLPARPQAHNDRPEAQ